MKYSAVQLIRKSFQIAILTSVLSTVLRADSTIFFEGSFEAAQLQAKASNKILLLDFTAKWCLPCRWMEKTIYNEESFHGFAKQNLIILKVDVDDLDGITLKLIYDVSLLPTTILLDPQGQNLGRKEESMTLEVLTGWIKNEMSNRQIVPFIEEETKAEVQIPEKKKEPVDQIKPQDEMEAKLIANANGQNYTTSKLDSEEMEKPIHEQIVEDMISDTEEFVFVRGAFYIEAGLYATMDEAVQMAEKWDLKFKQNSEIEQDFDEQGNPQYKVSMGSFETEEEAQLFISYLKDSEITAKIKRRD